MHHCLRLPVPAAIPHHITPHHMSPTCVHQPGAHHPAHVGGPAQHVPRPHILVEEGVGAAAQRGGVAPGDGLGLACGEGWRDAVLCWQSASRCSPAGNATTNPSGEEAAAAPIPITAQYRCSPPVVPDEKMTPVTSSPPATCARITAGCGTASRKRSQERSCGRSSTCAGLEAIQVKLAPSLAVSMLVQADRCRGGATAEPNTMVPARELCCSSQKPQTSP